MIGTVGFIFPFSLGATRLQALAWAGNFFGNQAFAADMYRLAGDALSATADGYVKKMTSPLLSCSGSNEGYKF